MADGWGAALQAGVNGYFRGAQMTEDAQDRKDEKAWRDEQRAAMRQQLQDQQAERTALKDAGRPIALVEGAGGAVKPPEMDNRDVGLPENAALPNQGLQQGGFIVAGKSFGDRGSAEAEVTRQNSPEAVNQRAVQAYRGLGQHDKAMALEQSTRAAELQNMQLADQRWKRDLGKAMRGGHAGLAQLATGSEAGAMAGMKVSVVPSADGKTVTYAALDKDGKASPIPGLPAFSNDQNGLVQAAWMLDQTITPEARMAHYTTEKNREEDRGDKKENRDETKRHNMAMEGLAGRKIDMRGAGGGGKAAGADGAEPFNPLGNFDVKKARAVAMEQASKAAENSAVSGKPMSPKEQAKIAQDVYQQMEDAASRENSNRHVQQTVSRELRTAGSNPAQYAASYDKAQKLGLTPEALDAWGFKPPGAAPGAKPSAPMAAAGRPVAPPAQAPIRQPVPQSPADDAGSRVDAARANLAALRSRPAPGLAAGQQAREAYAAQLDQARAAVAQAESEYQSALPPEATAAFVRPSR
ncbi:hypothetical protein [Variovorax sp. PAMC26660]|uniref:hypothetical protein n=1 Tax=Variovorax sp. PAMC26660 TaxID=2762322 RepID=UPI00164E9250|nr:hypothetical protein [Variovorax sp. PAMC26660]QNK66098.1 hypothetical protein H7F35_23240 [Variovorax sp. PAMC26660]